VFREGRKGNSVGDINFAVFGYVELASRLKFVIIDCIELRFVAKIDCVELRFVSFVSFVAKIPDYDSLKNKYFENKIKKNIAVSRNLLHLKRILLSVFKKKIEWKSLKKL
jgi:hypothetical protein